MCIIIATQMARFWEGSKPVVLSLRYALWSPGSFQKRSLSIQVAVPLPRPVQWWGPGGIYKAPQGTPVCSWGSQPLILDESSHSASKLCNLTAAGKVVGKMAAPVS